LAGFEVTIEGRAEGQQFALSQFRSPAYHFNISVTRPENIKLAAELKRAAVNS